MVGRGEIFSLERLMMLLPEEVIRSRTQLYLTYIVIVLAGANQWDAAEMAFRDIEQRLGLDIEGNAETSMPGPIRPTEDDELARIAGFVATGRANIAWEGRANLPKAIALNRRAPELLAHDQQRPT